MHFDWSIACTLYCLTHTRIFSLRYRRHLCRRRVAKFKPILSVHGFWTGSDLFVPHLLWHKPKASFISILSEVLLQVFAIYVEQMILRSYSNLGPNRTHALWKCSSVKIRPITTTTKNKRCMFWGDHSEMYWRIIRNRKLEQYKSEETVKRNVAIRYSRLVQVQWSDNAGASTSSYSPVT